MSCQFILFDMILSHVVNSPFLISPSSRTLILSASILLALSVTSFRCIFFGVAEKIGGGFFEARKFFPRINLDSHVKVLSISRSVVSGFQRFPFESKALCSFDSERNLTLGSREFESK